MHLRKQIIQIDILQNLSYSNFAIVAAFQMNRIYRNTFESCHEVNSYEKIMQDLINLISLYRKYVRYFNYL